MYAEVEDDWVEVIFNFCKHQTGPNEERICFRLDGGLVASPVDSTLEPVRSSSRNSPRNNNTLQQFTSYIHITSASRGKVGIEAEGIHIRAASKMSYSPIDA